MTHDGTPLGATPRDGGCEFLVWAPRASTVSVATERGSVGMTPAERGYFHAFVDGIEPGSLYAYEVHGRERPDPASKLQPQGVHGRSAVVDVGFTWSNATFEPPPLHEWVIYELHVGTFSEAGTFEGAIEHLPDLVQLGVRAVEIMPVAQFPGTRNWGYDGVGLFATAHGYGGPEGLARFVDACHRLGLAVILDVVYNHLGPEGNYLAEFGPYFTETFQTPWGPAMNFAGAGSDEVRRFAIDNACMWLRDYHIDALRLDAVHGIIDPSPTHVLAELHDRVRALSDELGRDKLLIAESDANDPRLIKPRALGGYGLDAVWADDFHHALHVVLTGERNGYYADYAEPEHLRRALEAGFSYQGEYSAFRERRHGGPTDGLDPARFVICAQNHDQVGNRLFGDRLSSLTSAMGQRLAAALLLTSAHVPLLFMGQEYGELRPFQYFVDHSDPGLIQAVREGRKREWASFAWDREPPDPAGAQTYERSTLDRSVLDRMPHAGLLSLYQALIALRRDVTADGPQPLPRPQARLDDARLTIEITEHLTLVANLGPDHAALPIELRWPAWCRLDGDDPRFGGTHARAPGKAPPSLSVDAPQFWFAIFEQERTP